MTNLVESSSNELVVYGSIVDQLVSIGMAIDINSVQDVERAVDVVAQTRSLLVKIDETKKNISEEARGFVSKLNAVSKKFCDKLETLEASLEQKLSTYISQNELDDVQTELASCKSKIDYDFVVENLADVPTEFLMVDEKKIKAAIKFGMRHIPGIKIRQQKKVEIRRTA